MNHHSRAFALMVLVGLVAGQSLADTREVTVAPGWVELQLPKIPDDANVTWEAKKPLTLSYREYNRIGDGARVCVLYLSRAGQYVLMSDVIDWEARDRYKTTWVVTVSGDGPSPDPDDPIIPTPDVPDNLKGFAAEVYKRAVAAGIDEKLGTAIGDNYVTVARDCRPNEMPDGHVIPAKHTTALAAIKALAAGNKIILPKDTTKLRPFFVWWSAKLNERVGVAKTEKEAVRIAVGIFGETATGLKAIK